MLDANPKILAKLDRAQKLYPHYFIDMDPLITTNEDNDIVCEWWNKSGNRKITIYFCSYESFYIKVPPDASISEMEEGDIEDMRSEDYKKLFNWLEGK